jgi:hypothetical protein
MRTLTLLVCDESLPCRVAQSVGHVDLASEGQLHAVGQTNQAGLSRLGLQKLQRVPFRNILE